MPLWAFSLTSKEQKFFSKLMIKWSRFLSACLMAEFSILLYQILEKGTPFLIFILLRMAVILISLLS